MMPTRLYGLVSNTAIALAVFAYAPCAWAAEWRPPVSDGVVLLAFGVPYTGGTHRGVDLSAEAGAAVMSPASGVVTFSGRVPADGGGTCGAVTVELADGQRVSLLPLEDTVVVTGDRVAAGDALGAVAECGDDSSGDAHLHIGLRSGDLYLDPTALLPQPAAVTEPEAESVDIPVAAAPPAAIETVGTPASAAAASSSASVQGVAVEVPTASVSAVTVAPAETAPTAAHATSASTRMPIADGGAPQQSALVPDRAGELSRGSLHVSSPAARTSAGVVLALGVGVVGVSIVITRRVSPVRAN